MSISFLNRSSSLEIMDDFACAGEVVIQTLRELDIINHWLGGNAVTIHALKQCWNSLPKGKEIVIADLGCGSGEMLRIISRLADIENRKVLLMGFDANPHIVEYARNQSKDCSNISFETVNVFSESFKKKKFDIVLATLFMHHFKEDELVTLLSSLIGQAQSAIIINDIHRNGLAYHSIKWLTQWFSRSSMVKYDAPLSVLRAFNQEELREVMRKTGINRYQLKWKWAFRWQLIIPL